MGRANRPIMDKIKKVNHSVCEVEMRAKKWNWREWDKDWGEGDNMGWRARIFWEGGIWGKIWGRWGNLTTWHLETVPVEKEKKSKCWTSGVLEEEQRSKKGRWCRRSKEKISSWGHRCSSRKWHFLTCIFSDSLLFLLRRSWSGTKAETGDCSGSNDTMIQTRDDSGLG